MKTVILLTALLGAPAFAQSPDAWAVRAFVRAIDDNVYSIYNIESFDPTTVNMAERDYLAGVPTSGWLNDMTQELYYFNLYWNADPNHTLYAPPGPYFGNTTGIDNAAQSAVYLINDAHQYEYYNRISAPEIDPSQAAAGLMLLFGSLAVLSTRTRSKNWYRRCH